MRSESLLSGKTLRKIAVYIAFVVFFIFFSVSLRNVGAGFLDLGNLMNILRQTSLIAIIAVGMTFALGAAQIDLSIGPIVGVTSLVTAVVLKQYGIFPGVIAGLAVGAVVGSLNGV
ncbi:MAG: ABC transporter permease, partial [Spirochaetia bacterium]